MPKNTERLTQLVIASNIAKLRIVFPSLAPGFYDILVDRLQSKRFSDSEFIYVTNHVIDNCKYPQPTIADFINYDKDREMPSAEEPNPDAGKSWLELQDKILGDPIPGYVPPPPAPLEKFEDYSNDPKY